MVSYNCVLDVHFMDGEIVEPVTLSEAKDFCKIDISTDDAILTELIVAAREMCEDFTNIGFVPHLIRATLNNTNGDILLPYGPAIEIIEVRNSDGDEIDYDNYKFSGNLFLSLKTPKEDGIEVTYTSGYQVLPKRLKTALLNTVYYLWDNRAMSIDHIYDKNVPKVGNIGPISEMILKPISRVI
jgi:uncharacterized phiE125 gp8 family phage protein